MTQHTTTGAALAFLDDKVFYADMIDLVQRDAADILQAGPDGVLLRTGTGTCLLASANEATARRLLTLVDDCRLLVAHSPFELPLAEAMFGLNRRTTCLSSAYVGPALAPVSHSDLRIEPLTLAWQPVVSANYAMDGPDYHRSRIEAGQMWGAFRGDDLTGFIGLHEEGAMGLLVVLEPYRRQGIARYLLTHLTNDVLSRGLTPYDHIIVGNAASAALQAGLGFTISSRTLAWISRSESD